MLGRREFIQRAAVAAALLGIPKARAEEAFVPGPDALPPLKLANTDPERYWAELRRQWLLAPDRINLDSGALGSTPLPVLRAMIDHLLSAESFREPDRPWLATTKTRTSGAPATHWHRSCTASATSWP
jgi:hypothetical protein